MSLTARNALIALGITILIVFTVAYTIAYLDRARVAELNAIEDQLATDTLSLETEYSLLSAAPCDSIASSTAFISALSDLGERLVYAENQLGSDNAQVIQLKKQYTLIEIRDYLLTKQIATTCHTKPVTVLYFYSNTGDCEACDKAGYALSYLHNTYPNIRVYSFDYHLDLGALQTLIKLNKVTGEKLPVFIIQNKPVAGFTTLEDLEKAFPAGALSTSTPTN